MLFPNDGWPDLELLEAAPILIWRANTLAACDWFNSAWLAYRGRQMEQELGNGWAEGVHPDDFQSCLDVFREAFAARRRFEMEYRILRADGQYGWIVDYGVPIHSKAGTFLGYVGYCFDITARRASEEGRRRGEAELRAIYDATNVAIFHVNGDGAISQANRRAIEMFGFNPEAPRQGSYYDFLRPEDRAEARANLERALREAESQQIERLYQRAEGTPFWGRLSIEQVHGDNGQVTGLVAVVVDITERKTMELELEKACRTLRASNAELEQFAYVASHDLREPLRMISSYITLLERRYAPAFDAEGHEFLAYIHDGAVRMDQMVLDLLAFSRIDRTGLPIVPIESGAALTAARDNLKLAIGESDAVIEVTEPLPVVMGDIHQIISLFQNLLGNAIKYRRRDSRPHIRIGCGAEGEFWHFTVADDGIGIAPEFFDRIFLLFQRLHTRQAYEGTGIGLALCRKIVERHHGRIWVESTPGNGATFHFTLRAVAPAE